MLYQHWAVYGWITELKCPWEMWRKFETCKFQTNFRDWYFEIFLMWMPQDPSDGSGNILLLQRAMMPYDATRAQWVNTPLILCQLFLDATKQLYEWSCPSVCLSVHHTFLTMFLSLYHHEIFMSNYHWQKWCPGTSSRSEVKGQGHRGQNNFCSNLGISVLWLSIYPYWVFRWRCCPLAAPGYVEHRLSNLSTGSTPARPHLLTSVFTHSDRVTPVWIHHWLRNDAKSLKQLRRGALLFFNIICEISRSNGTKNCQFWPKLSICGLSLQFEFSNGYEMIHKAWSSKEEVRYHFLRSFIKVKGHMCRKLMIWLQLERWRMITQIWIHGWL